MAVNTDELLQEAVPVLTESLEKIEIYAFQKFSHPCFKKNFICCANVQSQRSSQRWQLQLSSILPVLSKLLDHERHVLLLICN